jgi:hypothetical protein
LETGKQKEEEYYGMERLTFGLASLGISGDETRGLDSFKTYKGDMGRKEDGKRG